MGAARGRKGSTFRIVRVHLRDAGTRAIIPEGVNGLGVGGFTGCGHRVVGYGLLLLLNIFGQ